MNPNCFFKEAVTLWMIFFLLIFLTSLRNKIGIKWGTEINLQFILEHWKSNSFDWNQNLLYSLSNGLLIVIFSTLDDIMKHFVFRNSMRFTRSLHNVYQLVIYFHLNLPDGPGLYHASSRFHRFIRSTEESDTTGIEP